MYQITYNLIESRAFLCYCLNLKVTLDGPEWAALPVEVDYRTKTG